MTTSTPSTDTRQPQFPVATIELDDASFTITYRGEGDTYWTAHGAMTLGKHTYEFHFDAWRPETIAIWTAGDPIPNSTFRRGTRRVIDRLTHHAAQHRPAHAATAAIESAVLNLSATGALLEQRRTELETMRAADAQHRADVLAWLDDPTVPTHARPYGGHGAATIARQEQIIANLEQTLARQERLVAVRDIDDAAVRDAAVRLADDFAGSSDEFVMVASTMA